MSLIETEILQSPMKRASAHEKPMILLSLTGAAAMIACTFSFSSRAQAQEGPFTPWVGERGITETVDQIMRRDSHETPWDPREGVRATREREYPDRGGLPEDPNAPNASQWPPISGLQGGSGLPAVAPTTPGGHTGGPNNPQTVSTSFLGVQLSESGFIPPDTSGAVGPTQVLFVENGRIKVFSKAGVLGGLNVTTNSFFTSVRNGSGTSDPQVKYDRTSGRFIVTMVNLTTPNRVMIAVSSSSTITNSASFTFFFFQQDLVAPAGNTGNFADYPKTGVDANAIYIGINVFAGNSFVGCTGFCVQKASVLGGGPIVATAFRNIVNGGGGAGPFSPTGVDNDDPASTEGYFIGVSNTAFGQLVMRRVTNPGGSPSVSGNLNITVSSTVLPQTQPALGSTFALDSLDDRLFSAMIHKTRSTNTSTLWTAHNIEVNSSGVASGVGNRNGSRWYQVGALTGTPSLTQSGTLFDSAATNPRGFWIPSVAMSGQGHMALGASYAGVLDRAGCAVAGRLASDTSGTIQAATLAVVSATSYNVENNVQRWGDYSDVVVDPVDDQSMWALVEYCNGGNSWGVRAIKLLAPPPATPSNSTPANVSTGAANVDLLIDGVSTAGSGFYDTDPAYTRISGSVNGGGVTVNSITVANPTQLTMNVTVDFSATPGPRTVTITNPDGQLQTSAAAIVTIDNGGSPGTAFCFGDDNDPFFAFCPCGNSGNTGHGCNNSSASGGAVLTASGTASPDTVVLTSSSENPAPLTIFLQGDASISTGITFGDGTRCVSGNLKRLATKTAVAGTAIFPQGGDPSITARSAALGDPIPSGGTRYYQAYYRDVNAAFCPPPMGDAFNVSSGIFIVWP